MGCSRLATVIGVSLIAIASFGKPATACYFWSAANCETLNLQSQIDEINAREAAREEAKRDAARGEAMAALLMEQMRIDEANGKAEARRQQVARDRAAGKPIEYPDFNKPITAKWCRDSFGAQDERPMYMACMMSVGR